MGYDAYNHLPLSISKRRLVDFVKLLGFQARGNYFYYFKDDDYKHFFGIWLRIASENGEIIVHTHNQIYCSEHDLKYQNYVLKQIKQYFGGYFTSDYGKNRYFPEPAKKTTAPERGCYAAHFRLFNAFSEITYLIRNYSEDDGITEMFEAIEAPSGTVLLSNISTTYISSIIENYFRQLYVALLKYSDRKEKIIIASRVNNYDLFQVSEKKLSVEDAVALSKSFQNIRKIHSHFIEIDKRIDIQGTLSAPYRRRNETLFETIDRILEHRHSLVHRMNVKIGYKKEDVLKDINSIEVALTKVYHHICSVYGWEYEK